MSIKELNIVALLKPLSEHHLGKGTIGTIAYVYDQNNFEVEFADLNGQAYALLTLTLQDIYY